MSVLETSRLTLRRLEESDAERLFEIYRAPNVLRYFAVGPPETIDDARAAIRRHLLRYEEWGFGLWATVLHDTGELVGRCGLLLQNLDGDPEVEVAYLIAPTHWGRGLASEAARGIRDYGFGTLKQERLVSIIHVENERSKQVARAVGMAFDRTSKYLHIDVDVYAMRRPEAS